MDYPTRLDFCDGKYTVIYDFSTGQSECLRYGQPWRQLVGDKMVLAMFDRVVELQAENAALKAEIEEWQKSVCEQGEVIEGLKAELASWKSVFGHLGTADECGNEWIALQDKLAAAQKDAFRAGMLAAAAP